MSGVILILKCNYRVKECMRKGITDIDPNIDGGSWLSLKEHVLRGNIIAQLPTKPPDFPTQWNRFSGQEIPKFYSYGRIYQHLIETCVLEGHKNFREATIFADKLYVENSDYSTAKPLRRVRIYFASGHVTDMQDSKTVERNHYCVRSLVLASYRKDQYNVFVMHINSFISFCTNSHAKKRCAVRLHFFINHT